MQKLEAKGLAWGNLHAGRFRAVGMQNGVSHVREGLLMHVCEGVGVDPFMQMLDDTRRVPAGWWFVRWSGRPNCAGRLRRKQAGGGAFVAAQQVSKVGNAEFAPACGAEVGAEDAGHGCGQSWRVLCGEGAQPRTLRVLSSYWRVPRGCLQTPARVLRAGMEPQKAQVLCMSRPKAHAGGRYFVKEARLSSSSQLIAEGGCSIPVRPAASRTARRSWRARA